MSDLARQLRWLILTRVVVVSSIVVPLLLYQLWLQQNPPEVPPEALPPSTITVPAPTPPPEVSVVERAPAVGWWLLLWVALATYLLSGVYLYLIRRFPDTDRPQAYLQLTVDLLLVTLIVWKLGVGVSNPFSLFYLLFIAVASFLLGRQAGFAVAILAYLFYAGLVIGMTYGLIPPAAGTEAPPSASFLVVYNLFVHLFAFIAIALLTAALARRLERTQRELEEEREDRVRIQVVHRDVIESIQSGLITTDPEGRITSVNRTGSELLDRSEQELLGCSIVDTDLFDQASWRRYSAAATEHEGRHRAEAEIERDGSTVYIGYSLSQLHDAQNRPRGYILIFQDFTRWRELEEQVRIKDRMAAIGELAAGIAHEIGNPLAAISGSVQMLSRSLANDDGNGDRVTDDAGTSDRDRGQGRQRLLDILLKESQRLDRTIKGFLRFARPRERSVEQFDIAALLEENCELLRNSPELSAQHRLIVRLDPPSVHLHADPDQVTQIFWNLVRNALRAMEDLENGEGGRLEVSGRTDNGWYVLEVADTGRGMSEEERANLFHPFQSFFDTGTGIGMAIVYRIVEEHQGHVSVSSRSGGGTRITVKLPLAGVVKEEPAAMATEGRDA